MEVSALKYAGGVGLHARSPLLRLQSDERLVALIRRGNATAFEVLVSRYESRLLAFCRHLLSSREDAEDVLQEVFAAAFNAMTADERPINVRPWLYRIARNRSLNHLRRMQAIGVDSMDVHLSDNGASTADKVHERLEFRLLVGDIHELPETQKTALVLREMDALSYEQIAEAMETTVPSVKSLLVRARISLAEASEARLLSCNEVRIELGEIAEGLQRRPSPLVRRHLRACTRCSSFRSQLKQTNKALAAVMPIGPLVLLKKLFFAHLGHSAGSSATGAGAAGSTVAAGSTIVAGSTAGGFVSAGMGAIAAKAAAGLAAAALVTAGAVEVDHSGKTGRHQQATTSSSVQAFVPAAPVVHSQTTWTAPARALDTKVKSVAKTKTKRLTSKKAATNQPTLVASVSVTPASGTAASTPSSTAPAPGRTQTQSDPTVLAPTQTITTTSSTTPTQTPPPAVVASPPPSSSVTTTPPAMTDTTPTTTASTSTTATTTSTTTTTTTSSSSTVPGSGGSDGSGSGSCSDPGSTATCPGSGTTPPPAGP